MHANKQVNSEKNSATLISNCLVENARLIMSRFMGSRSHPRFVLCVCVCVSRCLWVCVIEADSLQLRVITVGYIRSCHAVSLVRSLQCLPCSGWQFGPFLFLVPRFLSPAAFLDSERRRLVCPLLPCATRLCLPASAPP